MTIAAPELDPEHLLRARFEIYRPFYAEAAFYPPNQFLDAPMTAARELAGPADKALRNLVAAGIVPETP